MSSEEEERETTDRPPESVEAQGERTRVGPVDSEDAEVAEWDPARRFHRYEEEIGTGKFKTVFRGYDTENGIDVAWSKVRDPDADASESTLDHIYQEMKIGLTLDHSNIVRCFACWLDTPGKCINLITELFTSGSLRSYREIYSNAEVNVHRKYVRQILSGLVYLHTRKPPVIHADLRLDKIYVNGFNGEVKIGDLGLTTLLSRRYQSSQKPEFDSPQEDLVSLGLCVYELLTGVQVDRRDLGGSAHHYDRAWLEHVRDPDARGFIAESLDSERRPTAAALLEHRFLYSREKQFRIKNGGERDVGRVDTQGEMVSTKLRGEDVNFELQGCRPKNDETSVHVQLIMSTEAEAEHRKILDFDYNLENDTPDSVGGDIADAFQLSCTDRELCKAALKEWLEVLDASKSETDTPKEESTADDSLR